MCGIEKFQHPLLDYILELDIADTKENLIPTDMYLTSKGTNFLSVLLAKKTSWLMALWLIGISNLGEEKLSDENKSLIIVTCLSE